MSLALCLVVLALLVDSGYAGFFQNLFKRKEDACSVDTYESIRCRRVVDKNNNKIIELKETTQLLDKYDISYNSHMHEYLYKKLKNENTIIDTMLNIYRDEQRFMLYTMVYYYQCFIFPCTFAIITITTCYMLYYYIFFAQNFKQIWFTASLLIWMLLLSIVYYSLNFIF